jgi:hypothetical protein
MTTKNRIGITSITLLTLLIIIGLGIGIGIGIAKASTLAVLLPHEDLSLVVSNDPSHGQLQLTNLSLRRLGEKKVLLEDRLLKQVDLSGALQPLLQRNVLDSKALGLSTLQLSEKSL